MRCNHLANNYSILLWQTIFKTTSNLKSDTIINFKCIFIVSFHFRQSIINVTRYSRNIYSRNEFPFPKPQSAFEHNSFPHRVIRAWHKLSIKGYRSDVCKANRHREQDNSSIEHWRRLSINDCTIQMRRGGRIGPTAFRFTILYQWLNREISAIMRMQPSWKPRGIYRVSNSSIFRATLVRKLLSRLCYEAFLVLRSLRRARNLSRNFMMNFARQFRYQIFLPFVF